MDGIDQFGIGILLPHYSQGRGAVWKDGAEIS